MTAVLVLATAAAFAQTPAQFDVKHYGARGDGSTLDTASINRAIDACAAGGGGTVYVPAGTYLTGTVQLKDNITLWLDAGATLLGSKDLQQYKSGVDKQNWYRALVLAKGVHHVAVMGRGTIDGNQLRDPDGEEHIRGPHALLFYDTRDVTVRDISIKDAGNYALIVRSSEGINIDGLVVHGGWDGINMHDTRNATIANSRLFTGDDSLAGSFWENVTVTNCILNASANAIRVGGRNVLFSNLMIYGPGESRHLTSLRTQLEAGFQILPNRAGAPHKYTADLPVDNMVLSNVTMLNAGTPVYVAYSEDAPYSAQSLGVGRIIINDLTVLGAGLTPFYVSAPPNNPAKSIILNHIRIQFAGGATEAQAEGQGFSPFSILQSYGLYARHVEHVGLHDVRFDFSEPDLRPAIFTDHVSTLELDGFHAARAAGGAPSIEGDDLRQLLIDGKTSPIIHAHATSLQIPEAPVTAGERFPAVATVDAAPNAGTGLASFAFRVGDTTVRRSVWLDGGQTAEIRFLNLRQHAPGTVTLKIYEISKSVPVKPKADKADFESVGPPYRTFHNVNADLRRDGNGFYIRAAGDFPVMQYGDQYGAVYLERKLAENGTVTVRIDNPDGVTNWQGRVGLMVRNDIAKRSQSSGYLILAASPAAGSYLEWDANGTGTLNQHTEFRGNTIWPQWLKLERHCNRFAGFKSLDGVSWEHIGDADVPSANPALDVGIFAFRSSARFVDWMIAP